MIEEIHPAPSRLRPPMQAVAAAAAANAAANQPSTEDLHALAGQMRQGRLPGGPPASLPGLGGRIDIYATDTAGKPVPGLYGEGKSDGNFPYLEPLAERNPGNGLNTVI